VVSRTSLFRARADREADPRAGRFRTALAALFPAAPSVSPGPGGLLRASAVYGRELFSSQSAGGYFFMCVLADAGAI
jgi:hypothetical protein